MKFNGNSNEKWVLIGLAAALLCACQHAARDSSAAPSPENKIDAAAIEPAVDVQEAIMAGEFAWQDGRLDSAAKHFARAAMASTDAEVIAHALQVMFAAKRWDLAAPVVDRAAGLPKFPQDAIWQGRAAMALAQKEESKAVTAFKQLLAYADQPRARKKFVPALLMAEDRALAIRVFERLLKDGAFQLDVEQRIFSSQVAEQLQQGAQALALAESTVGLFPESVQALRWRGELLYRQAQFDLALKDFDRALQLQPQDKDLRLLYAVSLDDRGQTAKALEVLAVGEQNDAIITTRAAYAAQLDDQNAIEHVYEAAKVLPAPVPEKRRELLGQLAEMLDEQAAALEWYRGIGKGELYVPSQLRVAILQDQLGDLNAAMKTLDELRDSGIDDNDQLRDSFLVQSEIQKRRGDFQKSLQAINQGLMVLNENRDLLYARAIALLDHGDVKAGVADLRALVEKHPDDADLMNALGYTLTDRTDQHQEALQWIEKALAAKPGDGAMLDSLGWVKYHLGDLPAAEKHLRDAWGKQTEADIAMHLAEVLLKKGDRAGALAAMREGESKNPGSEVLKKARERLGL